MSLFLWSDTHFNHRGILDYCAATRPYANVDAMNASLIDRWNFMVTDRDDIWLLGDFGFKHRASEGTPLLAIYDQLRGRKHLVIGNHDEKNPEVLKLPWHDIKDLVTLRDGGRRVIACHYPLETWKGAHRGYLHAHGHSHVRLKRKLPHRFDVGADVFTAGPVSIGVLFDLAAGQEFYATDHHGDA